MFERTDSLQISEFKYNPTIQQFNFKRGILQKWSHFLLKQEWFISALNSEFCEIANDDRVIFNMMDRIIKVCHGNLYNKDISPKVLKTLELFSLGMEFILRYINENVSVYNVFLNFDKFIKDNTPKFIKAIVTKNSRPKNVTDRNDLSPKSIFNYFYENLLHDKYIDCIDYNIILSFLVGDSNTRRNVVYDMEINNDFFVPLFYIILSKTGKYL